MNIARIKAFLIANKLTVILGIALIIIIGGFGWFLISRFTAKPQPVELIDVDLPFDPNGAYGLLVPRRDGHAVNLNLKRISQYEALAYQIAYTDDKGIERGAGDLNTWVDIKGKSDFSQEILFGTCSKGNTMDPLHCVFDTGVSTGTLTLRLRQGNKAYKMETTWHLQQPDLDLGKITSDDKNFSYTVANGDSDATRQTLSITAYTLVNNLSGTPKLPDGKTVTGTVYALNIPDAKSFLPGDVSVTLQTAPPSGSEIAVYVDKDNTWKDLATKTNGNTLTASAPSEGIFAVLSPQSK